METRWLYVTSENFPKLRDESKKLCVIPMGCIEKHGLHLPLGTDILKGSRVAYEASKLETVTVFPDFTFGDICAGPHLKYKPAGLVSLGVELQMELLEKLCDEIAENGYEKILVVNSHGGNGPWLSTFARNLGMRPHKFVFGVVKVPFFAPHGMAKILDEKGSGSIPELTREDEEIILRLRDSDMACGHACMGETALMMGVEPESVHLDRLGIESGARQRNFDYIREAGLELPVWGLEYPNWFKGDDPVDCNERIGAAALRLSSEYVANAYKVFKEDEILLEVKKKSFKDGLWDDPNTFAHN